jgi:peptidoglycan/xylan/chitin deacetylase (PgdA/CDA1 family)
MSKRRFFTSLLQQTGALSAILKLREHAPTPWLSILTYHRFPKHDGSEPFDDGVIDTTAQQFEEQLLCLKRHFTFVGMDELCAFAAGATLPRNSVAITFDDGYLDNCEQALPILRRHAIPATFFIATSFISERRLYWWDRAAYILKRSQRSFIELRYPQALRLELEPNRSQAIFQLLRFVKEAHAPLDLTLFLDELAKAAEVAWTSELEREFAERLLMTWDHVRELRAAGMSVQSHTRTHRILQTLPPHELEEELSGSRRDIERELGEPARAIAYPVGKPIAKTSPIRAALSQAGYEIGFTNGTGPTSAWAERDRFDIGRQTVARDLTTPFLLSILAVPPLAPRHPWHLSRPE